MAQEAFFKSILVLSGNTKKENLKKSYITPDITLDSVDDLSNVIGSFKYSLNCRLTIFLQIVYLDHTYILKIAFVLLGQPGLPIIPEAISFLSFSLNLHTRCLLSTIIFLLFTIYRILSLI